MKTKDELIAGIYINEANIRNIADHGRINGTLLVEIRRVLEEYATQQTSELRKQHEEFMATVRGYRSIIDDLEPHFEISDSNKQVYWEEIKILNDLESQVDKYLQE